ncbi:MAG: BNR-4 repeat-containing protein, partial [Acidimicrobiales bacterium]|nr:BNR-4 repeat-containing protein [Acidimicrobiales bacterium]
MTATSAGAEAAPGMATADAVSPAGTTVLLEDAAWSWFEDERLRFSADGTSLLLSGVASAQSTSAAPGTVVLAQLDLASGTRHLVDLGVAEADDHNSASIHEASSGELTTAWSRHSADALVRTQRRRTDGSWLRLPPLNVGARTTYSNLRASADGGGQPVLYDFVRGERFDPEVIASPDEGRTWTRLGRVLRDPTDSPISRPYVQYSADVDGRIDLLATETHPRDSQTSIYHGFIRAGLVHDSAGTVLGPLGSAIPVTALTQVWTPPTSERAWTADLTVDPATGAPVAVFSVRHTVDDHRFWYATWADGAWHAEEIAPAGRA